MNLQTSFPRFGSDWKSLSLGKGKDERVTMTRSELFTLEYDAFSRGKKQGFDEGRVNGQSIGLREGFGYGYAAGRTEGYEAGLRVGLQGGQRQAPRR